MKLLVTGPVRSGKSRYAQARVQALPAPWTYLATGRAWDPEMAERIRHHQADRGPDWRTVEEPVEVIPHLAGPGPVLLDCLTLWLTNVMLEGRDPRAERERLVEAVAACSTPLALVTNEVGWGIVPENALARAFRDESGRLSAALAQVCEEVVLVVAGLPLHLKGRSA